MCLSLGELPRRGKIEGGLNDNFAGKRENTRAVGDAGIEMGADHRSALSHNTPTHLARWGPFCFLPLPPPSKKAAYSCNLSPVLLHISFSVLPLSSLTLSQLTRHVSPIFDRFGLLVFRDKHLCAFDQGIDILSKGPSLPSLCSDTTHHLCRVTIIALATRVGLFSFLLPKVIVPAQWTLVNRFGENTATSR